MTETLRDYEPGLGGERVAALLIHRGEVRGLNLPVEGGWEVIQSLIGNYFTSCFTVHLPGGDRLVGYCDEEFLLRSEEEREANWNVAIGGTLRRDGPYPIGGPIVVERVNPEGDSVSMQPGDFNLLYLRKDRGVAIGRRIIPVVEVDREALK